MSEDRRELAQWRGLAEGRGVRRTLFPVVHRRRRALRGWCSRGRSSRLGYFPDFRGHGTVAVGYVERCGCRPFGTSHRDVGGDHGAPVLMTAPSRGVTEPKGDRMSRTDKTRPWWVKMADRPMVTCRPQHDHRFEPCTLPERINATTAPIYRPAGGCCWVVTDRFASMVHNGCRGCTGYYFRREDRRRSRHQSRRELRAYHCED